MAEVAERHGSLLAGFEAFRREAAFGTGPLAEAREAAFRRFLARGFPTSRDEEWKFTNIGPIAETAFAPPAAAVPARAALEPFLYDGLPTLVVVNGRVSKALSSLEALPPGVTITSASGLVQRSEQAPTGSVFVDLNTAFFEEAVVITVAAKAIVTVPLHVMFVSVPGALPTMVSPRLVLRAGEQSQVSLIETFASAAAGVTFTNAHVAVDLGPHAVVDHVKIQCEPLTAFHLANMAVHLDRASTFTSRALTFGGRISRNDITAVLGGEGAECTLNGLYVTSGESLVDTHTTIDHAQPHCPSHEVYKGILSGRSKAVFNGKIIVRQDAQKTDAKQTNKALLLSDDAQINTKPQLEIFADDVKCTHGAAIGQLDDDAMFYLRARGVGETEARAMLIHAFAGQIIDGIATAAVRERVQQMLDEKLAIGHA